MGKASIPKDSIDSLIKTRKDIKKQYGISRQNFSGVSGAAVGNLGGVGGGKENISKSGSFLSKSTGGTMIGPLAFCMGFCFPTGLRIASRSSGSLVPWAWAASGFGSVTGAVAATLLAVSIGFTWLIVAALGMYVAASFLVGKLAKCHE